MKKGLVNIAQGTPEQLSKVKVFLANSQVIHKGVKTHGDAVVLAIEQAQKVPELETQIREQKKRIEELEDAVLFSMQEAEKVPALENEISVLKRRIRELEGEKEEIK